MKKCGRYVLVWCVGAILYGITETLFRGFTHWSMPPVGGICMCCIYHMNRRYKGPRVLLWIMSASVITAVEYVSGAVLNKGLGLGVWDYSDRAFNLFGQICPLFTVFWFLLSIPAAGMCTVIDRIFIEKSKKNGTPPFNND